MKDDFQTIKDAEKYAQSLLEDAKREAQKGTKEDAKKLILEAKKQGDKAIQATRSKKEEAKERDKKLDEQIEKLIKEAGKNKVKGHFNELLPRLYLAINVVAKVADRGVSHALMSPIDSMRVADFALDVKKRLEQELKTKNLKDSDTNKILQSDLVTNFLSDSGLWQVIGLQSAKFPRILARFRETIGKEIRDVIETPSALTTETKLYLGKEILKNEDAVDALVKVAKENKLDFAQLLTTSKTTRDLLAKYGIDGGNIERLLPSILTIVETLPKNRESILEMVKIAEPVILGTSQNLDVNALIPHLAKMIDNDITKEIAGILNHNQKDLFALANNKELKAPLEKLGLEQDKALAIAQSLFPVLTQALDNKEKLKALAEKMPAVTGNPVNIKEAIRLIPDANELLLGKGGVIDNTVRAVSSQKDTITAVAASTIKQNPRVQTALQKIFQTKEQVQVPQELISQAFDVATNILDESNHKHFRAALRRIQRIEIIDNKPIISNQTISSIAADLVPILADENVFESIETLLTPKNIEFLSEIPAIKELNLNQTQLLEVSKEFLPVAHQLLEHGNALDMPQKLSNLIAGPVGIKEAIELIPEAQELMLGQYGVLKETVKAVTNQTDNISALAASAVKQNSGIQTTLQQIFQTKEQVAIPQEIIKGAMNVAVSVLDVSNHKQVEELLKEIQKIQINKNNKPVLSNVRLGQIGKQAALLLMNNKTIESTQALLTPENITFLQNIPALKPYLTPQNNALIMDAGKNLLSTSNIIKSFITDNYNIVTKVLKGRDNLENGIFEDTDLTPKEVTIGAKTLLQVLEQINPTGLLTKHKENIAQQIAPVITRQLSSVTASEFAGALTEDETKKLDRIGTRVTPIIIEMGAILLKKEKLKEMEKLVENLEPILDATTPLKIKAEKTSELVDFFAKQVKEPEVRKLYDTQIIPFLNENKDTLSKIITNLPKKVPALNKFEIDGEKLVNILTDKKTINKLEKAYDAFKDGSYIKAISGFVKASVGSKDLRSVIASAAVDIARESLVPNSLRRWLVGSKVNCFINECSQERKGNERINLAEKFEEKSQEGLGIFSYTLRSRICKGLDFGGLNFKNVDFNDFDFREASFGNKAGVDFSGANFKNVKFDDCVLRGNNINLSNATFDLPSLKSIIPELEKALKHGQKIDTQHLKINITNAKDLEELQYLKQKTNFGKLHLNQKIKLVKENTEIAANKIPEKFRSRVEVQQKKNSSKELGS